MVEFCQAQFQLAIQASAELRLAILSLLTPPTHLGKYQEQLFGCMYGLVWVVCFGMVWYSLVWFGMVWAKTNVINRFRLGFSW